MVSKADIDACLADNPILHVTPGALSASKAKGAKVLKDFPPAPPVQVNLSDDDEPGDDLLSQGDETQSDDEPQVVVHQTGKRKGKALAKPLPKRPKV